ncbi:MAG: B12-binding domain-containing radical SAM protein, partial [Desulfobulbaceae bacterium]|nr:B12-binding domain-containing radical SAM protein [Desulfobulbaceae bacterium]
MFKEPSVCLVSPATRANSHIVPTALLYISAWLEKHGIEVDIIDQKIKTNNTYLSKKQVSGINAEIVNRLKNISPTHVGITCYTFDYRSVKELAGAIKNHMDVKIIVGGVHARLKPEDFLYELSPFDYVAIGEGEELLVELLRREKKGTDIAGIKGLAYKKEGNIIKSENESYAELKYMPIPSYEKIDMEFYVEPNRSVVRALPASGVHIFTTKGCPYACTFCANRQQKVRYRPVESVVEEIEFLKNKYSIDSFYIQDDTFCLKEERVFEFADCLEFKNLGMFWGLETRVNLLTEDMIKRLKKAGCIQIDFGVESGSQECLDRMKKKIKVEDTIKIFALCRKYGLRTFANFMFNTPDETEEDVKKTIGLMKEIKSTVYGTNLTIPLLGTKIYDDYVIPKLTTDEYALFEDEDMYRNIKEPRFKLAKHNIDLKKLKPKIMMRFMLFKSIIDLTTNKLYWK